MLTFIITLIKLIIILGVVATIHEFGHFLASKLCKIGVNEFSIGFGPKIIQKKYKGTMYSLRCIPLGGYCAIEGEEGTSDREDSFEKKNVFQKIFVLIMGVTFNALLALIIFMGVAFSSPTATTQIKELPEVSILRDAGIQEGDTITAINGKKIKTASELLSLDLTELDSNDLEIEYERDNQTYTTLVKDAVQDVGYIGITFVTAENGVDVTNQIEIVAAGGVASNSGLKAHDTIIAINGEETKNSTDVKRITSQNAGKEIEYTIDRNGEILTFNLVPESKKEFNLDFSVEVVDTNLTYAWANTKNNVSTIIKSYVDLFKGKVQVDQMSGIVGIGEVVSTTRGVLEFLNLMAIISLAVGVANILPFPPLDGGKVVIVIGEAITRKKLPENAEAIISYIGLGLLLLLTIFITYKDIIRIL